MNKKDHIYHSKWWSYVYYLRYTRVQTRELPSARWLVSRLIIYNLAKNFLRRKCFWSLFFINHGSSMWKQLFKLRQLTKFFFSYEIGDEKSCYFRYENLNSVWAVYTFLRAEEHRLLGLHLDHKQWCVSCLDNLVDVEQRVWPSESPQTFVCDVVFRRDMLRWSVMYVWKGCCLAWSRRTLLMLVGVLVGPIREFHARLRCFASECWVIHACVSWSLYKYNVVLLSLQFIAVGLGAGASQGSLDRPASCWSHRE